MDPFGAGGVRYQRGSGNAARLSPTASSRAARDISALGADFWMAKISGALLARLGMLLAFKTKQSGSD
jgi:hypothetical protein